MAENVDFKADQERIRFNIGGQSYETFKRTLQSFPNTRISDLSPIDPSYCSDKDEYFFDRNPSLFPFILDSFREGEINFPASIPAASVKSELKFWRLEEDILSAHCRTTSSGEKDQHKALFNLNKGSNIEEVERRGRSHAIWVFLDKPCSSVSAMVWSAFYVLMILLTVAVISAMSIPGMQKIYREDTSGQRDQSSTDNEVGITALKALYIICALFFLIELVIRFAVCPNKLRFFSSFFNDIDVLAIIPMFIVGVILVATPQSWMNIKRAREISFIHSAISILRASRILKLGQQVPSFKIIGLAVKASIKEVLFFILMLVVGIVVFGTIVFWVEESSQYTNFRSIPDSFWYCIVTMTTVGYGDMSPVTHFGKFLGSICALSGVLVIILPIPVFVYNYQLYRDNARVKGGNDCRGRRQNRGIQFNLAID